MTEINLLNQLLLGNQNQTNDSTFQNSLDEDSTSAFGQLLEQIDESEQALISAELEALQLASQELQEQVSNNASQQISIAVEQTASVANNVATNQNSNYQIKNLEAKLLPFTSYALGHLSYMSKSNSAQSVANSVAQQAMVNATKSYSGAAPSAASSQLAQPQSQTNQVQTVSSNSLTINNRSLSYQINETFESQLQKSTYSFNTDEYQLRKFTYIENEKQNLILVRDYRLTSSQEEQIAKSLDYQLSGNSSILAKQKLIINGTRYRG